MPEATPTTNDMPDLRAITETAKTWLASQEGKAAVKEVLEEAQIGCERFDREIRVTWETLRAPITL